MEELFLTGRQFKQEAMKTLQCRRLSGRQYRSHFGCSERLTALAWNRMVSDGCLPTKAQPKHLLWTLFWMKSYETEEICCSTCNVGCENTFRKWRGLMLQALKFMDLVSPFLISCPSTMMNRINFTWCHDTLQIRLENRNMNDIGNICRMSVDGTDFRIREPQPFNPKWYSEKFNGPRLRYEVGICIRTGWICWLNGPFPCGHWPDIRISRDYLVYLLDRDERLLSDGGYPGQYHMQPNPANRGQPIERMKALARARHENINGCFKVWRCLKERWRHPLELHEPTMWAICNLTAENTLWRQSMADGLQRPYSLKKNNHLYC
jgi:hypothetical protein